MCDSKSPEAKCSGQQTCGSKTHCNWQLDSDTVTDCSGRADGSGSGSAHSVEDSPFDCLWCFTPTLFKSNYQSVYALKFNCTVSNQTLCWHWCLHLCLCSSTLTPPNCQHFHQFDERHVRCKHSQQQPNREPRCKYKNTLQCTWCTQGTHHLCQWFREVMCAVETFVLQTPSGGEEDYTHCWYSVVFSSNLFLMLRCTVNRFTGTTW